jgi:hypothetical protein
VLNSIGAEIRTLDFAFGVCRRDRTSFSNNVLRHDHAYKEVSNPSTDFGDDVDWSIFKRHILPPEMNGMPAHWQRIIFFPDGKPR